MLTNNVIQSVPNLRLNLINLLLCILDAVCLLGFKEALHHEGTEQLQSHFFRQTALVNFQFRSNNDNGTTGIVNTLTEQVLTETTLLTAQHFRQRLEGTVGCAGNGLAALAVVDQGVNKLLEHTFFVADDDTGSVQLQHLFQTVITVNNTAIQLVEVRGGKTAAIQLYHRTNVGRNNRQCLENHPLGAVAGLTEAFNNLKTLNDAYLLLATGGCQFIL